MCKKEVQAVIEDDGLAQPLYMPSCRILMFDRPCTVVCFSVFALKASLLC